jgi:hypothetical protein
LGEFYGTDSIDAGPDDFILTMASIPSLVSRLADISSDFDEIAQNANPPTIRRMAYFSASRGC